LFDYELAKGNGIGARGKGGSRETGRVEEEGLAKSIHKIQDVNGQDKITDLYCYFAFLCTIHTGM
jgi:hypothetical protein